MSISKKKTRQFKCPNCGGELELVNKRTQYVSCPYCGSTADASSDAYKVLTQGSHPDKFKPRSFLKLGLTGDINGKAYKIIGRTAWKSNYREYWVEDGEAGYSNEIWTYDEWLLINEDGSYLSIIEDSEGYYFSKAYLPKYPNLPGTRKIVKDFNDGRSDRRVHEYGDSTIQYFEGESTYLVETGNKVGFSAYELKSDNETHIAEWRYDDEANVKEIEFFKEYPISKRELMSYFDSDPKIERRLEAIQEKRKEAKINKALLMIFGALTFAMGVFIYINHSNDYYNNKQRKKILLSEILSKNPWQTVNDSVRQTEMIIGKPFSVYPEDERVSIDFIPFLHDSTAYRIDVFVLNDKNDTLYLNSKYYYKFIGDTKKDTVKGDKSKSFKQAIYEDAFSEYFAVNYDKEEKIRIGTRIKVWEKKVMKKNLDKLSLTLTLRTVKENYNADVALILGLLMFVAGLLFIKVKKY